MRLTGKWRPNKEYKPHYGSFDVQIIIDGQLVRQENLRKVDFNKSHVYKGAPELICWLQRKKIHIWKCSSR